MTSVKDKERANVYKYFCPTQANKTHAKDKVMLVMNIQNEISPIFLVT